MQNNLFSSGFIGQNLIILASVPSTNDYLKEQLSKSAPFAEGTVIMAVDQFAGKGQKGADWQSEAGKNLTFSLLLRPKSIHGDQQFVLTAAISLALVHFLESVLPAGHAIEIKWPNDIYVDGKKIAGMLIENSFSGSSWKYSVVGIGLNINQLIFPDHLVDRVTSLKLLTAMDYDVERLLKELCVWIERYYSGIDPEDPFVLLDPYVERLYQLGEEKRYLIDLVPVPGKIVGVTEQGRLRLDFNGHLVSFDIKEIRFT